MTSTTQEDQVLQSDTLGRVQTPLARREALLDEFERSGISAAKFARMVGINYQTFANWTQRRKQERGATVPSSDTQVRWVEAVLKSGGTAAPEVQSGLNIHLPGGVRMEILDPRQAVLAAELLRILAKQTLSV